MIKSILVANRGEIACRIFRTCTQLGIKTIAVFSDADRNSLHVKMADTAYYIGSSEVSASYLNIQKIIAVAKASGADAVHPGYGFLSENEDFARALEQEKIIFIGPNSNAIEWMGSKSKAKEIAKQNNVPVVPGYNGTEQSLQKFSLEAKQIGFPILLKAAAGGGGKGMRIVNVEAEFEEAFNSAKREAHLAFGSDELIIEKYFSASRHIEIQIFGDKHGNAIHLFERECSLQRRYQKIIEESPSPILSPTQREAMCDAALRMAKALNYDNAGTVEFIYSEGEFYFLEVNTRLQVEHPVTEAITGLDLVKMQIEVAEGKPLSVKQEDVKANGYALQCRIYAEDTTNNFLPATGTISLWQTPKIEGLRFDSGIKSNSDISIFYDPMIAKVIAHGTSREETIRKMIYGLRKTVCLGSTTNQQFLLNILARTDFEKGDYNTHFITNNLTQLTPSLSKQQIEKALIFATLYHWQKNENKRTALKHIPAQWRSNFFAPAQISFSISGTQYTLNYRYTDNSFSFKIGEENYTATNLETQENSFRVQLNGVIETFCVTQFANKYFVQHFEFPQVIIELQTRLPEPEKNKIKGGFISPMPASVVKVLVKTGDKITNGQALIVLTSMKMENTITAIDDGTVEEIFVAEGENIEAGKLLLKINEKK